MTRGAYCRFDPGAPCGKCVPALQAGDRCSLAPADCVFGTRCVRDECTIGEIVNTLKTTFGEHRDQGF